VGLIERNDERPGQFRTAEDANEYIGILRKRNAELRARLEASRHQRKGAAACRDALAKLIRDEWPTRMSLVEIAETHQVGFGYEITDDEMSALREWEQGAT
jgi:hypothetical protein